MPTPERDGVRVDAGDHRRRGGVETRVACPHQALPGLAEQRKPAKAKPGRRWNTDQDTAHSDGGAVGQVVSVPGRFVGGAVDRFGNTIAGNAALIGVGGDPVRAWTGLLSNVTSPAAGAGRAVASATPEQILADPIAAAGSAATHAPAAVPFVGWAYGLVEWATKPGELAREGAKETLTSALDTLTLKNLEASQTVANTGEVQVTTPDVDIHADNGGYVTFTLPDLEGGEPKAWYILATPDSPGNFTTNVATGPGEELIERADGSVVLINTGTGQVVRTVKAPWAKDALGRDQPTWYSIERVDDSTSTITQHIAPNKGALYPLVADAPRGGALVKPPSGSQIAGVTGGGGDGGGPTTQSDGFSQPVTPNAVNAPYERPQGSSGGTTTTPQAQAEPYIPSAGGSSGGTAKVDPQPYRPNPAPAVPVAPPKPDSESGQDDDKQSDAYVGAVTDVASSFRDDSAVNNDANAAANPSPGTGIAATDDKSAELTRLLQSGVMNTAMLEALGYRIDASGKVVKDTPTGPPVSVELAPGLAQSPVAGLIVPQLQAGGAQVKVKEPAPGTPQDNGLSSVSIGDPGKQVDTYLVRGDGATSRTQSTRTPDGIDTITQTFDGARIDGATAVSPDGRPASSSWKDSAGNRGVIDNGDPQQRTRVEEANGSVSGIITTGEIGNVYKVTTLTPSGEVIRTATTDSGRDTHVELLPNPDPGGMPAGTQGHREGDTWTTELGNGLTVENTIPYGNGNRTVDQKIFDGRGYTYSRVVSDGRGGWQRWNTDSLGRSTYAVKPGLNGDVAVNTFAPGVSTSGAPSSVSKVSADFTKTITPTADGGKIITTLTGNGGYGPGKLSITRVDGQGNITLSERDSTSPVDKVTGQLDSAGNGWWVDGQGRHVRDRDFVTTTNENPLTGARTETKISRDTGHSVTSTYSRDGILLSEVKNYGGSYQYGFMQTPDGRVEIEVRPNGDILGRNADGTFVPVGADGRLADGLTWFGRYGKTVGTGVADMVDGAGTLLGTKGSDAAGKAWSAVGDSLAGLVGQDKAGNSIVHNQSTFWTGTNANQFTEEGSAASAGAATVAAIGYVPVVGWLGKLGRAGRFGSTVAHGLEMADHARAVTGSSVRAGVSSLTNTLLRRGDGPAIPTPPLGEVLDTADNAPTPSTTNTGSATAPNAATPPVNAHPTPEAATTPHPDKPAAPAVPTQPRPDPTAPVPAEPRPDSVTASVPTEPHPGSSYKPFTTKPAAENAAITAAKAADLETPVPGPEHPTAAGVGVGKGAPPAATQGTLELTQTAAKPAGTDAATEARQVGEAADAASPSRVGQNAAEAGYTAADGNPRAFNADGTIPANSLFNLTDPRTWEPMRFFSRETWEATPSTRIREAGNRFERVLGSFTRTAASTVRYTLTNMARTAETSG
ncbi:hypothetical protein FK529_02465 [Tsukamurella asaccharolytica]|uniref:Uncharacterized protein n=1 Tax=Tsukamurella asaccharolytica TaxID=2592067 RepID=A0A5C5RFX2_9ACTN|nr:hypothetical protein [Tsukamurella asaccharolytica]TWS21474.1 hypothetical protein FK529_02465 [Tsukamurella asaccharolytica]